MSKLATYLMFPGNAEEAFNFYKAAFGGEFSSVVRFKDMPIPGVPFSNAEENKIMHISLPFGKDNVLMGADSLDSFGRNQVTGNNFYILIHPDSKAEADRFFIALSAGGKIEHPLADQPWGDYYGSFTDKFGIQWMVDYEYPK